MFSVLIKYLVLSLSRLLPVWETKPHCIGDPLKPEQFSKKGDVGFVRDVCVDIVARNIYNSIGFPVSTSCKELAAMEVLIKAEELMGDLLHDVSSNMPEDTDVRVGESLYEHIQDAKRRLADSGAVAEDSLIVDSLEDLKLFLCKPCTVMDNPDVRDAIHHFIALNDNLSNPRIEDSIGHATITGLFCLKFDVRFDTNINTGSAILKVPSLAPFYNTKWKFTEMYSREAQFYGSILPTLYQMGNCQPFAPRAYVITRNGALLLEDLSPAGYIGVPRLESLDLDHCKIFLTMLAQYHALSHVYFYNLDENDSIKQLVGFSARSLRVQIAKKDFDLLCEMVKSHLSETLYQKIVLAEDKILAQLHLRNENDPNSMNVIMHGDLHRKNFLFNYDSNGKVQGIKLLDWQVCTIGGAALDLIEFFVQNIHEENFEANEDYLLDHYIATFNHNLSVAQSNRFYNRLDLNRDMEFFKYYYFRVLYTIVLYWGASQSSENYELVATNIAKWIMYFEKKGYI